MLILTALAGAFWTLLYLIRGFKEGKNYRFLCVLLLIGCGALILHQLKYDFIAQKIAGLLMMPTGILWAGLFAGLSYQLHQKRYKESLNYGAFFLALSITGSVPIGARLMNGLERQYPVYQISTGSAFEAVFVLGGGSKPSPGRVDHELAVAGDRIYMAARLYHAQKAPLLVSSGHSIGTLANDDLSLATSELWQAVKVPEEAIIRLQGAVNTRQEMVQYAKLIKEKGWKKVGLISSAYHLPRAMALAKKNGITPTPIGADHHAGNGYAFSAMALVPHWAGFLMVQKACWEYLGKWVGR